MTQISLDFTVKQKALKTKINNKVNNVGIKTSYSDSSIDNSKFFYASVSVDAIALVFYHNNSSSGFVLTPQSQQKIKNSWIRNCCRIEIF